MDRIISAELPNRQKFLALFDVVSNMMMHSPCGPTNNNAPCMIDEKCSKHFPKKFNKSIVTDEDGYPWYKRSYNGSTIERNEVLLVNRYVIPYNPTLLLWYKAHMNVERWNQSRSIKYLIKYVSKGQDRCHIPKLGT